MIEQQIAVEPDILQFGSDTKKLVKIINKTGQHISNCFFCLFNTSRYEFTPESFPLEPWEHKIVTITLLYQDSEHKLKEYAYLKSKNYSKRLTFIWEDFRSPEQLVRSPSSGFDQLYTLTSQDYRDTQKAAYERVIGQKEAYIKRLERRIEEQEQSQKKDRTFTSDGKKRSYFNVEMEGLEKRLAAMTEEKQAIMTENSGLREKILRLEAVMEKQKSGKQNVYKQQQTLIEKKEQAIRKLKQDMHELQIQCEDLLIRIAEKQQTIRRLTQANNQIINELASSNEVKLKDLQAKIDQQNTKHQQQRKRHQQIVKGLEQRLSGFNATLRSKEQMEKKLLSREKQLARLTNSLQEEKKKSSKLQNERLSEENTLLKSKISILEKSMDELREQTIIFRSKVTENEYSDRPNKYLQVAVESCKNENQLLRKSKAQAQASLAEQTRSRRNYQARAKQLETEIKLLHSQIAELKLENKGLVQRSQLSKDQSHETILKLRAENIDLIEKMSVSNNRQQQMLRRQLNEAKNKLAQLTNKLNSSEAEQKQLKHRLKQSQQLKQKMAKKIEKYRTNAKKELKDITESTLSELKKCKQQNKSLQLQVQQLRQDKSAHQRTVVGIKIDDSHSLVKNEAQTRYPGSQSDRRTGIKNQRREIVESSLSRNENELDLLYHELGELRELRNYIAMETSKIRGLLDIPEGGDQTGTVFGIASFFNCLEARLRQVTEQKCRFSQAEKQINFLRGRLVEQQIISRSKIDQNSSGNLSAIENTRMEADRRLLELLRQQMKNQSKKLNEALKISEEKYQILQKKIYEQYRSRIIGVLNSKQKLDCSSKLNKIQSVLERFVEGLANRSHREAVLSKQIKLKNDARKQAGALREKVGHLNQLLQTKKSYCTRQPLKVFQCQNEEQWHDNIRLQAKVLTYQADNARLNQQLSYFQAQYGSLQLQLKSNIDDLEAKQKEIVKLKKEVVQIEVENAKQMQRRQDEIQQLERRFFNNKAEDLAGQKISREKSFQELKEDVDRKKELIKHLSDKVKMLEQIISSSGRDDYQQREKSKSLMAESNRVQESLREFRESNRQLKAENSRLREQVALLKSQIAKKNTVNRRIKNEAEQSRIRSIKQESNQIQKLYSQIHSLKQGLRISKQQVQKSRSRKEKEVLQLESEIKRLKNQFLIEKSSLESVVRALCDCIRRLYTDLQIIAKKKGKAASMEVDFQELFEGPAQIDSLKVYECFESLLTCL